MFFNLDVLLNFVLIKKKSVHHYSLKNEIKKGRDQKRRNGYGIERSLLFMGRTGLCLQVALGAIGGKRILKGILSWSAIFLYVEELVLFSSETYFWFRSIVFYLPKRRNKNKSTLL